MEGKGDQAWCMACGTRFSRGRGGGRIRIREESGKSWDVPSHRLSQALDALGGAEPRARTDEGHLFYQAEVEVRVALREEAIWFRGRLLGYAEVLEAPSRGLLELTDEALALRAASGPQASPGGQEGHETAPTLASWPLLEIRAVQTSSRSVQISLLESGVVEFRFPQDSSRRWEDLLHRALRKAYVRDGRGSIQEFQPRIVVK